MRLLPILIASVAVITLGAAPAQAADKPLQDQIDQILEDFPGGVQTSATTISWDGGAMVLTLEDPDGFAVASVGTCARARTARTTASASPGRSCHSRLVPQRRRRLRFLAPSGRSRTRVRRELSRVVTAPVRR